MVLILLLPFCAQSGPIFDRQILAALKMAITGIQQTLKAIAFSHDTLRLHPSPRARKQDGQWVLRAGQEWIVQNDWDYFFNCFSLCFLLFSSLSFLVIGFFLVLPVLNAITTQE
jgi:hypothetical protein